MNRKILRIATFLILALVLCLTISLPAFADRPGNAKDALRNAIDNGGDRLLATQGPNSGLIPYNWEWVAGDGNYNNKNLQGITAAGLLAAFEKTGNRAFLTGAKNAGNILKQRYAAKPNDRPYAQDVEFLVQLYKDTKDKSYLDTARNWYKVVTVNFTAEANVNRLITARASMAGWDIAAHIRAANAAGFKDYARDMADETIRRAADWVNKPSGGWDYTSLSYGSLLWALHEIGGDFRNHVTIDSYRNYLSANQTDNGSWDDDYQTTAYIILGLEAVKGGGRDLRETLSSAIDYLVDNQADNGGWVYTGYGEYPEIDSECVMALQSVGEQEYTFHIRGDQHGRNNHTFDFHSQRGGHSPR
jgi:hypothetical protein